MLLGLEAEGLVSGVRCRYAAVQLPLSHNHTQHSTYCAHMPISAHSLLSMTVQQSFLKHSFSLCTSLSESPWYTTLPICSFFLFLFSLSHPFPFYMLSSSSTQLAQLRLRGSSIYSSSSVMAELCKANGAKEVRFHSLLSLTRPC